MIGNTTYLGIFARGLQSIHEHGLEERVDSWKMRPYWARKGLGQLAKDPMGRPAKPFLKPN